MRTYQSPCAAQQLRQLLATVSFHRRSHHAFCCLLPALGVCKPDAPALREAAVSGLGVTEPDGIHSWNHSCTCDSGGKEGFGNSWNGQ
jgi:hypothetical protein